jgi:diadenosine tetraphosphate (Ap4A) HIT family hydrolase
MKASGCPFCHNLEPQLASNLHAFFILDSRPVSPRHSLVISRNHAQPSSTCLRPNMPLALNSSVN